MQEKNYLHLWFYRTDISHCFSGKYREKFNTVPIGRRGGSFILNEFI